MADSYECGAVIVGAGVIGLAVARALAEAGFEPVILERNRNIGAETSSRNSEVIHAGIYYPEGSLKARLCVRGRSLLYDYCASRRVEARRVGKLIVSTSTAQDAALEGIANHARTNGVSDVRELTRAEARDLEPNVACTSALLSPSTGIVDSHQFMLSLLGEAESAGGMLAVETEFLSAERKADGRHAIRVRSKSEEHVVITPLLVNAAGLWASKVARAIEAIPASKSPVTRFCRGRYCRLEGRPPFTHLVYPVPEPGGLGVHVTLDLGGQVRFGPDVEWLETPDPEELDYAVDPGIAATFAERIRAFWPDVSQDRLIPAYAGIRPKLSGPGNPSADFRIDGPDMHGVPGVVNLFGIESPGLTSSLAIAEHVLEWA